MTKRALRLLPCALTALAFACPNASAAPATGPQIGATPTTALVTGTSGTRVSYGPTSTYGQQAPASGSGEFLISGLTPATTYHYRVESQGAAGAWTGGADMTFSTSAAGAPELDQRPAATADGANVDCTPGTWTSGTLLTAINWFRNGSLTAGNGTTFPNADAAVYACRVAVSNAKGSSYMTSAPLLFTPPTPAPGYSRAPSISGDNPPASGSVLTCDTGSWTGATSFDIRWLRNDNPVTGVSGPTYTVSGGDFGQTLVCLVTAAGPGGSTTARSAGVAVPVWTPAPAVTVASPAVSPVPSSSPAAVAPPVLVAPIDNTASDDTSTDDSTSGVAAASAALRTLLSGRLPTRTALLRPNGARLSFRAPEPLGMLRVKLLAADGRTVLAVGARWFDTARNGSVRMRLTGAGRRAMSSPKPLTATLMAIFIPDHGHSSSLSRQLTLRP